jgi:predicted permease
MGLANLWRRLRFRAVGKEMEADLHSEMQQHVELLTADLVKQGKSPEEARLMALRRFGNPRSLREASREAWGFPSFESFLQDLRFGVRLLARSPGFTLVAVLTLAIGIGANTAVFSSVNALLLRSLPYPEPDRLVSIYLNYVPEASYELFKERANTLDLAGFNYTGLNLTGNGEAVRLNGAIVSENFFNVLGVHSAQGRAFQAGDNSAGRDHIAVLSYSLWQTRFASDPGVIGRVVSIDGTNRQIVGIMPPGFAFPNREIDVWIPFALQNPDLWGNWVQMFGRMKPGLSREQARAEMKSLVPQVVAAIPWGMPKGWANWLDVIPTQKRLIGDLRTKLLLMLGAVGLVLLIACANVANLLLARATSRQKEIAVRSALGAARGRIVRQLVTESILLALLGGAAGLALAPVGMQLVRRIVPENELPVSGVSLDYRVLLFVAAVAMLTGILFGVFPALRANRFDVEQALRASARSTGTRERRRLSATLVVVETALAMVLAVAAGLLVRSMWELSHESTGFNANGLVTASLTPSNAMCPPGFGQNRGQGRDQASPQCLAFYDAVLGAVRSTPGVESAAYTDIVPFGELRNTVIAVEENPQYTAQSPYQMLVFNVGAQYFQTLGVPLLAGRAFTEQDDMSSPGVVIVSRELAQRLWPRQNPIGKRLKPSWMQEWRTVVGMVDEVRAFGMSPGDWANPNGGVLYFPARQGMVAPPNQLILVIRTTVPDQISVAIPRMVAQINSSVPVTKIRTMHDVIDEYNSAPRTTSWLFTAFSTMALILGAVGIYSLISYSVTAQTQEIGIRMALGAERGEVMRRVLVHGLILAGCGALIGTLAALALTRLLRSLLYGIGPADPATFVSVAAVLIAVAALAAYLPARRAASIDPMSALRYE